MRRSLLLLALSPLVMGAAPALATSDPCVGPLDTQCTRTVADVTTYCEVYVETPDGSICFFPNSDQGPEWTGFTCGFASTNDPSGVINQDANVQMGEINCGPWTAANIFGGSAGLANIEICGWIQVNNSAYGAPASAKICGSGAGVAAAAGAITYTAAPTDNIFLCTEVKMTGAGGDETYQYDDDDAALGNQCALAISAGA